MTFHNDERKIFWAVDPDCIVEEKTKIIKMLHDWSQKLHCRIQPISVLSSEALKVMPLDIDIISSYLQEDFPKDFNTPDVVIVRGSSQRKMAYHLARYARKKGASYIFVQSRNNRPNWNPFRLGGFSEALLAYSLVPVVLLNVDADVFPLNAPVLFPTDFKKSSRQALREVMRFSVESKAPVYFYNQIESIPRLITEMYRKMKIGSSKERVDGLNRNREKKAHRWQSFLEEKGIKTSFESCDRESSLAQGIIKQAEKIGAGLIVLSSTGQPLPPALIGTTIRNVVSITKCPVMVINVPAVAHPPPPR